jgi:hypothetical protein
LTQLEQKFLPTVRDLVKVDELPPSLGFLQAPLGTLLDKVFYDNLVYHRSVNGDSAHYSLDVILKRRLGLLSIPGTDIALVLNPAAADGMQTGAVFSVTFEYEWILLRYIRGAQLATFSWGVRGFINLLSNIFGITPEELTQEAISVLLPTPAGGQDPVAAFVTSYNAKYAPPITYHADSDIAVEVADVVAQISPARDVIQLLVDDYLDNAFDKLKLLIAKWVGPLDEAHLRRIVIPRFHASLDQVSLGLELPRSVFIPLDANNEPRPEPAQAMVRVQAGSFAIDSEEGFIFNQDLAFSFDRSQILGTGFTIALQGIKIDLSEKVNIPEADADGRPPDFRGVYVKSAAIGFPQYWNQGGGTGQLNARNLLVGTGGMSGTIGLEAIDGADPAPLIKARFGNGFEVTLDAFSITFKQNAITESTIRGSLTIPRFKDASGTGDAVIGIDVYIAGDGDFAVTASDAAGVRIRVPNVFDFYITSASIGRKGSRFFLAVGGRLEFADQGGIVGQFLPDKIDIQKLLIWDDGKIEFEGGKITLPRAISLMVGPVSLSVTAIGFGSHEQEFKGQLRQYEYFTFDGGVNVNPGGVDVSGSGIAFYYTVDNSSLLEPDRFLRIQSIAVDLVIPGSASAESAMLLLKGYLSMRAAQPPSTGSEYAGSIAFTLPKLKMSGAASMRLNPSVPAFIVDAGLEIATPILLGSTALGIWGFRGLLGLRYVATKHAAHVDDGEPWWKYYKAKIADEFREGIQVSKFDQIPGFSLGAGVSLATAADTGEAFSSKLFFLLSLPEVFLLQGQGQILKGRILLTDTTDPPFFALISITKASVETAFGVKYAIPADAADGKQAGGIATVDAVIEMGFFWGSSAAWYINIGRADPASARVLVRLLSIIDAYFYFMMSGAGIRAGAGASYHLSKKFGPLKAELSAYLDTAGRVSFGPNQIGASIQIGGNVDLSIFGFGFGVSAAASLAAEGTKPFTIAGSLEVCVRVLRKNRCAKFEFTWIFNTALDTSEIRLLKENLQDSGKALNIHTQESYDLWTGTALPAPSDLDAYMLPLDSYVDIEFTKGVKPSPSVISAFGGNTMGSDYMDYVAPQRGKTDRVRHEYTLDSVEILYHDGTAWKPYDIYGAATPPQLAPFVTSNPSTLKQGFWQYQQPNLHNKLRVLAQSPLTYVSQGSGGHVVEESGITVESIFCAPAPIAETCTDFDDFPPLVESPVKLVENQRYFHRQFQFRIVGGWGTVVTKPGGGHTRAVRVDAGSAIEIFLIEPAVSVRLTLSTSTDTAVARFYSRVPVPPSRPGLSPPQYGYALAGTMGVPRGAPVEVVYDHIIQPVDKIVIDAGVCRTDPQLVCDSTVTQQGRDLERFLDTLIRRGEHLSRAVELYHRDYSAWDGIFFHTSLYPPPVQVYARYSLLSFTATQLHGTLADWRGFACPIELTLIEGAIAIDWQNLAGVHDLRPDFEPHVPGPNYTFLIDGDVLTPTGVSNRVTLRGKSCYPILHCAIAGVLLPGPVTSEALALGDLLALLAANNRLVQPRLALAGDEVAAFDRVFTPGGGRLSGLARKVWLSTTVLPDAQRLDAILGDEGSGGAVSLTLPSPRASFSFDRVIGFSDLRPDGALLIDGPNTGFLIDARVRASSGESTVTLRGEAPFTVTTAAPIQSPDGDGGKSGVAVKPAVDSVMRAVPSPPAPTPHQGPVLVKPPSDCGLHLHEVCALDYPAAAWNATLPTQSSVDAEVASIVNAFQGSIQPLWRPNTHYVIRVTTTDRLFRDSSQSVVASYSRQQGYGFRTVGPLGHFHLYPDAGGQPVARADYAALEALGRADEFKLIGLLHYVDFAKCYPNADGQLINAKPLFYDDPRLLLFYLQTYVARMFCSWAPYGGLEAADAVFEVQVKDPAPDPGVAAAGAVEATWDLSPVPLVSQDVTILNNMITYGKPCAKVSVIQPTWLSSAFPLAKQLAPLKLYTAIFNLRFKQQSDPAYVTRELLRYCFQTSRYANLAEQVNSYKLKVDPTNGTVLKAAVFEAGKAFTATDLANATSVLADTMPAGDPLRQTFADPFNRLIEGALKLEAIHPPSGTEFNIVRDTTSGRVLGLLVKNPEPFNDPKIPSSEVAGTIRLSVNGGSTGLYKAVYSKDLSQAFLTNTDNSMTLPSGATLDFTFDYEQWDGSVYATVDTSDVSLVIP